MTHDAAHTAERPSDGIEDLWRPRFGLVLLFISATFIFVSAAPTESWAILVAVVLLSATVLATAHTAGAHPGVRISVSAAAMLLVLGALIALLAPDRTGAGSNARGAAFVLMALMVALIAPMIVAGVIRDLRARGATTQAVLGAISVFVLLGILFAGAYGAVANIDASPFFTDGTDGDLQIRLYFSFVTLTTLGYGDFAPATDVGRTFATVEALGGQLYLVTVVAVLVGSIGRTTLRPRR